MSRRAVPPPSATDLLSDEVARFRADLIRALGGEPSAPVLLAVSGGPDSMAMLALAARALPGGVEAATVDHGLRAAAANEAAMVADHCHRLGVRHASLRPAVPVSGASLQAQARRARYALLADHARAIEAAGIATAHHADDQAETFLMRAARGSGLAGLGGVRSLTVIDGMAVLRPLLDWRRAELRVIVRRLEMPFVDDPTNADPAHDRTRFRQLLNTHEWLGAPLLARSAAALAEADGDLRAIVDWLWTARAEVKESGVRIAAGDLPREVGRRLARRAIGEVRTTAGIVAPDWHEAVNIEALLDALAAGRRATQAGVIGAAKDGDWRFRPAPPRRGQ